MRWFCLLALAGCATPAAPDTTPPLAGGDRLVGRPFATRAPVIAKNGMAATAHPLASQAAIEILRAGGSAVDAAIAANAVLGLMEPTGCGIGGDLFAIVWDPEEKALSGLNASGRAPAGQSLEALRAALAKRTAIPPIGALPVTVPGAVDGWFELHAAHGRLDMRDVLAPAIRYAEEGFAVTQLIAHYWRLNFERFATYEAEGFPFVELANARATYLIDGHAPAEGEVFTNPDLAKTYRAIAEGGRDAFYRGDLARTIAAYVERVGGALRYEDLASHSSTWVEPVSVRYRGYDVYELPPNTQGVAALQMLAMLEGFDLAALDPVDRIHVMVEAKRLAFEDRARWYADPAFADVPLNGLIDPAYSAARRASIDPTRAQPTVEAGAPPESGDTTYLTVADRDGMMVSLIQSNYRGMGSGLVPDGLGFMLQDRGELFALEPGHANVYAPKKRPFHTIIPAFVMKDGRPWLAFGVMGGAMQPQGHAQILVNLLDLGMNLQEAGDAARWRHAGSSQPTGEAASGTGTLFVERGISPAVRRGLEAKGHVVEVGEGGFGGYQAIRFDAERGVYVGASEMRKDGQVVGY